MARFFTLILFVIGTVVSMGVQAEIYKWKDSNGVIRYSDTPPNTNVPTESIKTSKSTAPTPTVTTKDAPDSKEDAATKRQVAAEAEKKSDEEKKIKKQNCLLAKDNLKNYQDGALVYKVKDNGEREYLDQDGMAKGMAEAQKNVKQYCN